MVSHMAQMSFIKLLRFWSSFCAIVVASFIAATAEPVAANDASVETFFQHYCLRCHNASKAEGRFQLDTLPREFTDLSIAQRWDEVLFRINSGEMPPKDEKQPLPSELGQVAEWISARIKEGEAARMARRGPFAHYRLSRDEYAHTVYDLLGVVYDVNLPGAFNEDPRWHGFDRLGSLLTLSPSHVERYFRAAEAILARAFPEKPPKALNSRKTADDGKWQEQGESGPVRWLLWPGHHLSPLTISAPGLYRIRIQLSGLPSFKGRLPHLALWHQGLKKSIEGKDVRAAEDQPTVIEFELFLPEGTVSLMNESPGMFTDQHTLSNTKFAFRNTRTGRTPLPTGYKFFNEEDQPIYPLLIVDWVEAEGPIVLASDEQKRAGLTPTKEGDLVEARDCLQRFAARAWRRPPLDAEIDRYIGVLESELAAGEKFLPSYRTAMLGILTSKNFYYLEEGSPTENRSRVNDWELASRLSYFLWNSMPDEELFAAARQGTLHQPQELRAQLTRMLVDPRISRFTKSFPMQWLQLHRVGQFPADPELYPDYDNWLETSMVLETTHYFDTVFRENRSVQEFLTSDWTMINPRLAMHYGLPIPEATGFRKLTLRQGDHRGGLLTQASILTLTSDGSRHRPVHRGVWVSEAIFGRTPPPPPPNVEPLAPTPSNQPKATIRQQLEAHATHATCASCHQKIDPLGLAFDSFDAIGRWRTEETVVGGQGANPPVNASGRLADGREFRDTDDFKRLLAQDTPRFAEALVEQLATYALRRVITLYDAAEIKSIAAAGQADGYRLQGLIERLVQSDLFVKR